jgi:hypothetical protein
VAFVEEVERGLGDADVGFYAYYYAREGVGEGGEGGAYLGCARGLLVIEIGMSMVSRPG